LICIDKHRNGNEKNKKKNEKTDKRRRKTCTIFKLDENETYKNFGVCLKEKDDDDEKMEIQQSKENLTECE
jgi:hypothetical protein